MKTIQIIGENKKIDDLFKQILLKLKSKATYFRVDELTDEQVEMFLEEMEDEIIEDEVLEEMEDEDTKLTGREKTYQDRLEVFKDFPEWESKITIEMKSKEFQKLKKEFEKENK